LIWLIFAPAAGTIANVSLSQIRYFVAVAEEGNVGRAARRLHVAQPPVSRQIRALEDEIGTLLFERTPRGMTLLPPGRVFLDHARKILAAVDRAVVAAQAENEPRPKGT
jgi:DNA-binding transcriptional LysR family regulator